MSSNQNEEELLRGETEGEGTNQTHYFYLDNQGFPLIKNPILVIYSGFLMNFEKPVVGTELKIFGTMYQVSRVVPPTNPDNHTNTYYVIPLEKDRVTLRKGLPHSQWQFTDC